MGSGGRKKRTGGHHSLAKWEGLGGPSQPALGVRFPGRGSPLLGQWALPFWGFLCCHSSAVVASLALVFIRQPLCCPLLEGEMRMHLSGRVAGVEMGKFMKPGKVVLVLAAIGKNIDDGTSDCPYSHALVAGIDLYPRKVTAAMGKKKIAKRSKIKSFVKVYNYNHFMPTRYSGDIPLDKTVVNKDVFRDPALKCKAKVNFEERHKTSKNKWRPQKLRF
uniref:60S ribosomal protein L27 n=1 Tax=Panthera tigris altaica TaxID=74533 RepID=A0A8C9KPF4_PANTA